MTRAEKLAAEIKRDTLTGIARALADEAVLIVGRLENLDRSLRGDPDAWLDIVTRMPPTVAEVVVSAPLAEARQQAVALAGILDKLGKALGAEVAHVPPASKTDELMKKRAERRAQQR